MKMCYVICKRSSLLTPHGGSTHMRNFIFSYKKNHSDIFFVRQSLKSEKIEGLKIYNVRWPKIHHRATTFFLYVLFNIWFMVVGKKIIQEEKPDLIYERESFLGCGGLLLAKRFGLPYVLESNALFIDELIEEENVQVGWFTQLIEKKMKKLLFKKADRIITVTEGLRQELGKRHQVSIDKISVVPNGTDDTIFKPMDQLSCRKELELDSEANIIISVGSLTPGEPIQYLIEAVSEIAKQNINVQLVVLGEGNMKQKYIELARTLGLEARVLFPGFVQNKLVPKYLNVADICVGLFASGRSDVLGGSPMKMFEYLACGKPIIFSDIPGVGDFIREHECGIAVKPDNLNELVSALNRLLKDKELRDVMGTKGREIVQREYTWKANASKTYQICKQLRSG